MKKLVLANADYRRHMTDEGEQLQRGLESAGWILAGAEYGDGCRDVPTLLDQHKPEMVFVQDKRDWDPASEGAFRKDVGFMNVGYLSQRPDIFKVTVVKDAGTRIDYQQAACEEIAADAVVNYYSEESVLAGSPWLSAYPRIRTWHTVDAIDLATIDMRRPRERGIVTGACSTRFYPLRTMAFDHARELYIHALHHPGYGNDGQRTWSYLRTLSGFKVHVATSSRFHFALRKIIESVAVGCTPITNLPIEDKLSGIDGALVRIPDQMTVLDLRNVIDKAEAEWDLEERIHYAAIASRMYDYREMGARLSWDIVRTAMERNSVHV